ncbi:lipopolysaccharide heptosyltransferase II [Desulfonatronum thioautotrophicum]|uniref:lipopolysaccharide heptosyltransferase II n=1 Tax=Desulfonatronum thioautotrophicum TaxID=617001 RepID=UPI0005EB351C|nr:lipopolysaccharide heptosyltransferase II [Desulfonatronum thioautotrophicum]
MCALASPAFTDRHGARVLLIGPSWVGDMVMAQSLVQLLLQHGPERTIDILAPAWSAALVARMPGVRGAVAMATGHGRLGLRERLSLGRRLHGCYEQAIVLPNSLKSALVPFFARIPRRTGYIGEWRYGLLNDWRRLDKARLPMTVQRFVALGLPDAASLPRDVPIPRLTVQPANVRAALHQMGLNAEDDVLILCPGAEYGTAKQWPPEHFAVVGSHLADRGWSVWVLGSEKDQEASQAVCDHIGPAALNLAGRTSLAQAVDLISQARAVVSNDSGLMHVAAALGRPLVAIFGSSDPGFTPPLSPASRIVTLGLTCSPCFQRTCPQHHLDCLRRIEPELVLQKLAELLPNQLSESATS